MQNKKVVSQNERQQHHCNTDSSLMGGSEPIKFEVKLLEAFFLELFFVGIGVNGGIGIIVLVGSVQQKFRSSAQVSHFK